MTTKRTTILVIDDSPTVCKIISNALAEHGYQAVEAFSMESALESFELIHADIVLNDIMMPGIGGLAGIAIIREKWPHIPVIAMSAGSSPMKSQEVLSAARKLGATAILKKPFTPQVLCDLVEDIIAGHNGSTRKERVLVVDDSKTICKMLTDKLNEWGYIAHYKTRMEDALTSEDIVALDLVVSDIFMPGLGGIEGISYIHEHWPETKILAISGGWGESEGADALHAAKKIGANAILKKPFEMTQFYATVKSILAEP